MRSFRDGFSFSLAHASTAVEHRATTLAPSMAFHWPPPAHTHLVFCVGGIGAGLSHHFYVHSPSAAAGKQAGCFSSALSLGVLIMGGPSIFGGDCVVLIESLHFCNSLVLSVFPFL